MKKYREEMGRSPTGSKKLLGVSSAKEILLFSPLIKWYLKHGLKITRIHEYLEYTPAKPFDCFPNEVADLRREADKDPSKKQVGETAKLKANSFYGKMIENLERHKSTKFTKNEEKVDEAFRNPFFENLEEIGEAFEIQMGKKIVNITRPFQIGISVYQLAKLRMLQFYFDFLQPFIDERGFELLHMDTDSMYMAISAESLDDIIRPEKKEDFQDFAKKEWFVTDKFSGRTPGLFKKEFEGTRMISLASKCYFADGRFSKVSCKGVNKRQNEMTWQRYKEALFKGKRDVAKNTGFRTEANGVVTYSQNKLGLSAFYDKRFVLRDGIHTIPLW